MYNFQCLAVLVFSKRIIIYCSISSTIKKSIFFHLTKKAINEDAIYEHQGLHKRKTLRTHPVGAKGLATKTHRNRRTDDQRRSCVVTD